MKTQHYILIGYGVFAVANYMISRASAGTLRTSSTPLLKLNDALANLNLLTYVLGSPTAPLAPTVTPVTLPADTVTAPGVAGLGSNVIKFTPHS